MTDEIDTLYEYWSSNKTCSSCGVTKPITDFYKHPGTRGGRSRKCIDCTKVEQRSYQKRYRKARKLQTSVDKTPQTPTKPFRIVRPGVRSSRGHLFVLTNDIYPDYAWIVSHTDETKLVEEANRFHPDGGWNIHYSHQADSVGTLMATVTHHLDQVYSREGAHYWVKYFSGFLYEVGWLCASYDATLTGVPLPTYTPPLPPYEGDDD